ncbi:hypothetical protein A0256_23160 [Mucilaginibacter sp. PAMC 26640]|nr:hypothetical protein A0256_23160 [Mucilaginibacter sp. PAMC 26640]
MDYKKYIEDGGQLNGVIQRTVETVNGTGAVPTPYYHLRMLRKVLSISGNWESITVNNTQIMAHVVAMNSDLPLAKRDSMSVASGKIPKMGLQYALDEQQLTDLDYMITTGVVGAKISAILLSDPAKLIKAVPERDEEIFLKGLSTGFAIINDDENTGTGIRLDYGYPSANKFGVTTLWSNTASKPFDDIQRVLDKAALDGNTITKVMLDRSAFNNMAKTDQAKQLFAFSAGFVGGSIPTPSLSQLNSFTSDRYRFTFEIVTKSFRYEKNGVQTTVTPWATGAVVFLTQEEVGTLTYAPLAESNPSHQVAGVSYNLVDDYMLLSNWGQNKPYLAQFSSIQARVVPVINNGNQIYLIDSTTVQA